MPVSERQLAAFTHDHETTIPHATSPRHLAGPGDARHVTHALMAADWSLTSDPACPEVGLTSPDLHMRLRLAPQAIYDDVWWRITGEPPNAPCWYVTFSRNTPVEVVAGFADALLGPVPDQAPDPWPVFRAADWTVTQNEEGTGLEARSPDQLVTVTQLWAGTEEVGSTRWQVTATAYPDDLRHRLWSCWLDEHAPAHALTGFAAALTSTKPLLRGWGEHGWHHDARHERSTLTGRAVAENHKQRLKEIQARTRAARRRQRQAVTTAPPTAMTHRATTVTHSR